MIDRFLKSTKNLKYISDDEALDTTTVETLCSSATWWSKENNTPDRSHDPVPQDNPQSCQQFHVGTVLFI